MTTPFKNTLRSLHRESRRLTGVGIVVLATLTAIWLVAALVVPVPVHVISTQARLITSQRPMPIHAPVALPVKRVLVDVGDRVSAGQLLLELDGGALPEQIEQTQTSLAAALREIAALERQTSSRKAVLAHSGDSAEADRRRVQAELAVAESQLKLARADWERSARLGADGVLSAADLEYRRAAVSESENRVSGLRASLDLQRARAGLFDEEQQVALATIAEAVAKRQVEIASLRAELQKLRTDLQRTRVTAPVSGSIGGLAEIGTGAVVDSAQWLLTLVPNTEFEVEAYFDPRALGQLRLGQMGRLRLDSFPWASYGLVGAKLSRLGSEADNELTLARFEVVLASDSNIPLQNGLLGQLEVEVRRVPAAVLLLEVIGRIGVNQA